MGDIKTHRDLIAWQKAMELARAVYKATALMHADERFGLTLQMRRSAVSVPSNIAEGYARQTTADYVKHLRIARGSLAELSTQYELAHSTGLMPANQSVEALLSETDRVLQGLIRSLVQKLETRTARP